MNEAFVKWWEDNRNYVEQADVNAWVKDAFEAGQLSRQPEIDSLCKENERLEAMVELDCRIEGVCPEVKDLKVALARMESENETLKLEIATAYKDAATVAREFNTAPHFISLVGDKIADVIEAKAASLSARGE